MSADHVTRAELAAHLEPMREDIRENNTELKNLRNDMQAGFKSIADSQWLGPQGRTFVSGMGLVSALAAVLIAVFR